MSKAKDVVSTERATDKSKEEIEDAIGRDDPSKREEEEKRRGSREDGSSIYL